MRLPFVLAQVGTQSIDSEREVARDARFAGISGRSTDLAKVLNCTP